MHVPSPRISSRGRDDQTPGAGTDTAVRAELRSCGVCQRPALRKSPIRLARRATFIQGVLTAYTKRDKVRPVDEDTIYFTSSWFA